METGSLEQNRANISSIETYLDKIFRGVLTDNLFFDELPVSLNKNWKELVVVDCHNVMRDHEAYGKVTILVQMYVKQNPYGIKDVKTMSELEKKLTDIVMNNDDPFYHLSRRGAYAGYDAVNDIYYDIVQLNLIIT